MTNIDKPCNVPVKNYDSSKQPEIPSHCNVMSLKTRDFIQKICYKKTASVDMTRFGFINDSKLHPVNILLKPLREQLEKICGKSNCYNMITRKTSPIPHSTKTSKLRKSIQTNIRSQFKTNKPIKKMRKAKGSSDNKDIVIKTEDLIAKRKLKKAAETLHENCYNQNRLL